MTDEADKWLPTELNVEGTFFDPEFMLRFWEGHKVGLWVWKDDWASYFYREPQMKMGEPN